MTEFQFIKDYKHIETYRLSFNQQAKQTFGIDFEKWYQKSCWNERYICYSYLHNDKVVANISVNLMSIIMNQHTYDAIQLGTVMTDPAYRNQGLSRRLMDIVIEEYRTKCSFFYLYANKSVLNFYTRFGFAKAIEPSYSFAHKATLSDTTKIRKMNIHSESDWSLLLNLYSSRKPVSSQCGVINAQGIFTWYCLNIFYDDIYVLEDLNTVVIYKQEDNIVHLFDIISMEEVRIMELVTLLPNQGVDKVELHYQPDEPMEKSYIESDDTLFIYPMNNEIIPQVKFPEISKA